MRPDAESHGGRESTTQDEIDAGLVNVLVGFAPLRPAEFMVIKVQRTAGRAGTDSDQP